VNRYRIAFSNMALDGKLPQHDPRWKTFNASFENLELVPPAIALLIDEGHAFTTWHGNNWRANSNYLLGQHLGVDFDTWSVEQTLCDPFVDRYAAIVYATPSSTPATPRSRALFLLDRPIRQALNYTRVATALIWMFGGKADAQCKDAARFFYGSTGSMPVQRPIELPLEKAKQVLEKAEEHLRFQRAIAAQRHTHRRQTTASQTMASPNNDVTVARRMLARLNPRRADDYHTWVEVGMALSTLGAEGLNLWIEWSATSGKFKPGECERKWQSFHGNGITLATVAHMVKQDSSQ